MNCALCGAPNDPNAHFCASCGKRLAAAALPPTPQQGPSVCAACGAIQLGGRCERCGGQQSVAAHAPGADHVHWVQLRLMIKCLTCQRASPLNHLAIDGRFHCYGCNREMFFDADLWKEKVVPFASALGDAYWTTMGVFPAWAVQPTTATHDFVEEHDDLFEEKLHIDNSALLDHLYSKCANVGRTTAGLTIEAGGMVINAGGMKTAAFALAMSPGCPLCPTCKTPLMAQVVAGDCTGVGCPRCNTREVHRMPAGASALGIAGVIAPEHVDGREAARAVAQPGTAAVAIACPKCGSGLQVQPGVRVTNCPYCKTTSFIPDQLATVGGAPQSADPLWLAFRAPSEARNVLAEASKAAENDRREVEAAVKADTRREEQREEQRTAAAQAASKQQLMSFVGGGFILVATVGAVVAFQFGGEILHHDKKKEGHGDKNDTPATTTTTKAQAHTSPIPIDSCVCAFGDGQSTPKITLSLLAPTSDKAYPWSLDVERTSGFVSESTTFRLKPATTALIPPASGATVPPRLGIACDTGIFVLVGDTIATGWSSVNASWKWSTTLPAAAVEATTATPHVLEGSDWAGGCVPLVTKNGATALTLTNGKHVSLSLKDGKLK